MRVVGSIILSVFLVAPAAIAQNTKVLVPAWSSGLTLKLVGSPPSYTGLPYSGKVVWTRAESQSDGSTITSTSKSLVFRDAEGRTRSEVTQDKQIKEWRDPQGQTHTLDVTKMYGGGNHFVSVDDPVAGVNYSWTVDDSSGGKQVTVSRHPPGPAVDPMATKLQAPNPDDSIEVYQTNRSHLELLGAQTINGLRAEGYRKTTVTEYPHRGTDVTEEWLSPDLKIVVRKIDTDPRDADANLPLGTVTHFDLTIVDRSDPDPTLFKAPEGYEMYDPMAQHNNHAPSVPAATEKQQ